MKKKISITRKVVYGLIIVTTLIVGIFGLINYFLSANSSTARLRLEAEAVVGRVATNALMPLWNVDAKQVGEVLLSEMTAGAVQAVVVEEAVEGGKKVFSGIGRNEDWQPVSITETPGKAFLSAQRELKKEDKVIGYVTVVISDRFLRAELQGLLWGAFLQAILIDLFVIIALQIIMRRSLVAPLQVIISELSGSSGQLSKAAIDLTHGGVILSAGSNEQAAAVEEISASLEELSSMTLTNNQSATEAKGLADASRSAVESGVEQMRLMSNSMDAARASTDELKKQMEQMKLASDGIQKIIKTINEIAFQTNILALNASVEAARAGQAGLGFAVVADEVRNLAQRAARAAQETEEKIAFSIKASSAGATISDKVAESLHGIIERVQAVDHHLKNILVKANDVDTTMGRISQASQEQTEGIALITKAIHQTDSAIQTGAAQAEETASCAEEISSQAKNLNESVADLLELIGMPPKPLSAQLGLREVAQNALRQHTKALPLNGKRPLKARGMVPLRAS
jgi:methyl-accepting chemotaxis protein